MRRLARRARAFSLIEFLIALTISSLLLAAAVSALDTSFKSYQMTTEQASTHVVARLTMHRLTTLIRTGENFGPYPVNPILTPWIATDAIEFETVLDPDTGRRQIWRVEEREQEGPEGPFVLWATVETYDGDTLVSTLERVMLHRVQDARFTLEYDVGPRLRQATIDLTVMPRDTHVDSMTSSLETPTVRMVASVRPRRLD